MTLEEKGGPSGGHTTRRIGHLHMSATRLHVTIDILEILASSGRPPLKTLALSYNGLGMLLGSSTASAQVAVCHTSPIPSCIASGEGDAFIFSDQGLEVPPLHIPSPLQIYLWNGHETDNTKSDFCFLHLTSDGAFSSLQERPLKVACAHVAVKRDYSALQCGVCLPGIVFVALPGFCTCPPCHSSHTQILGLQEGSEYSGRSPVTKV